MKRVLSVHPTNVIVTSQVQQNHYKVKGTQTADWAGNAEQNKCIITRKPHAITVQVQSL